MGLGEFSNLRGNIYIVSKATLRVAKGSKGQRAQGAFGACNGAWGTKGQRAQGAFGALRPGDQGAHGAFGGDSGVISSGWQFRMGGY